MGVSYEDWMRGSFTPAAIPPTPIPKTYEEWMNGGPVGEKHEPEQQPAQNSPQVAQSGPNSPKPAQGGTPLASTPQQPSTPDQQLEASLPKPAFVQPPLPPQQQPDPQAGIPQQLQLPQQQVKPSMGIPGQPGTFTAEPADYDKPMREAKEATPQWRNVAGKSSEELEDILRPSYEKDEKGNLKMSELSDYQKHAEKMLKARREAKGIEESVGQMADRGSFPFGSAIQSFLEDRSYTKAKKRIEDGTPEEDDFKTVAERDQLEENKKGESFGKQALRTLAKLPAIAGESLLAGNAAKGVGLLGEATTFLGRAGQAAALTPAVPSMYLEDAVERNIAAGRQADDAEGFAPALTYGAMANAVLGTFSHLVDGLGGKNLLGHLTRMVARTGTGLAEQQVVNVVAGTTGLNTGYGNLADLITGKKDVSEALKGLALEALPFGAMAAFHGGGKEGKPAMEAVADAIKTEAGKGSSQERTAETLKPGIEAAKEAVKANLEPEATKAILEKLPEGPAKDMAEKILERLPESPKPEEHKSAEAGSDVSRNVENNDRLSGKPESESRAPEGRPEGRPERVENAIADNLPGAHVSDENMQAGRTNEVQADVGGRRINLRMDHADNSVEISFTRPGETPEPAKNKINKETGETENRGGISQSLQKGSVELMSKLNKTIAALGKEGTAITYSANKAHAKVYDRLLSRSGYDLKSFRYSGVDVKYRWEPRQERAAEPAPQPKPLTRMEKMRQRQAEQGAVQSPKQPMNVLRSQERLPEIEHQEQVEDWHNQLKEQNPGVRYEHIPTELRQRSDKVMEDLPAKEKAYVMNNFRNAYAEGGEAAVHELLGVHEDMARPEEPGEVPKLIAELRELTRGMEDDIEAGAKRSNVDPETLRRTYREQLRKAAAQGEIAAQAETARTPAEGQREASEPASAEGAIRPSDSLSSTEKASRARYRKQFSGTFDRAKEMGLDEGVVHQVARQLFDSDKAGFGMRDDQVKQAKKEAYDQLKGFGISRQKIARQAGKGGDAAFVKGFDQVAQSLADRSVIEVRPDENPSDALWRTLTEPEQKPVRMEQAYEQAVDYLEQNHEAAVQTSPAENASAEALKRQGFPASEIAEALRSGQEAGFRESIGEQGELHERGEAKGAEAHEDATGEPGRGDSWEPESGQRDDAGSDPWDDVLRTVSGDPAGSPGGKLAPAAQAQVDVLGKAIHDMAAQDAGYANLGVIGDYVKNAYAATKNMFQNTADSLNKFGGHMYPKLTRLSRLSGEKLVRVISTPGWAKLAAEHHVNSVLGEDQTPDMRRRLGGMITETRLRLARDVASKEAAKQSKILVDANQAMKGATPEKRAELRQIAEEASKRLNEEAKAARDVKTFIGQDNFPFETEQQYQEYMKGPELQGVRSRYKPLADLLDSNFKTSQGMDENDPINAPSQIPGMPLSLKSLAPGEDPTATTVRFDTPNTKGNVTKLRPGRNMFAKRLTGASEGGYDIDFGKMVEHTLSNGGRAAAQADALRTLVSEGVAKWGKPADKSVMIGEHQGEEFRDVKPPPGAQEAKAGETSLYIHPDAADDVKQALVMDSKSKVPAWVQAIPAVANKLSLMSTVEVLAHAANLGTLVFKPGVGLGDIIKNGADVIRGAESAQTMIMDLARGGSIKFHQGGKAFSAYNPATWGGKVIEVLDHTMRLTMNNAFDRLAERYGSGFDTSETARRNFINQAGQYNLKGQNRLIQWARNTGLGPFATAGANFTLRGMESLFGGHGAEAKNMKTELALRAETIARLAVIPASVALANYFLWGRADGDDKTPWGSLKVGEKNGESQYLDLLALTPLKRGLKAVGAYDLAEGYRHGTEGGKVFDKQTKSITNAFLHPLEGPLVNLATIGLTGRNAFGMQVADRAKGSESQEVKNLIAAGKNANPVAETGLEYFFPKHGDESDPATLWKLAGPFGVRQSHTPPAKGKLRGLRRLRGGSS